MTKDVTMDDLLKTADLSDIQPFDVVEGEVIAVKKHEVLLDVGRLGVGLIQRRELISGNDLEVGQKVSASVIHPDAKQGYVLLSLRRAMKEKSWEEIQKIYDNNQIVTVTSYDANGGGLLVELLGIRGFLPISQLSTRNYSRVSSSDKSDKEEILAKLNQLVGQSIKVCIIDLNRKENKLICSEKEALKDIISEQLKQLKIGDVVEGVVTTVIDWGAFVNFNDIEGLIHISELSWERVEDPNRTVKVGQSVKVKIIAIDNDRVALSIKQLTDDPWEKETADYNEGDVVDGEITRLTPYGGFVRLTPVVEALLYLIDDSKVAKTDDKEELKAKQEAALAKIKKNIKVGDKGQFVIDHLDRKERKISLKFK